MHRVISDFRTLVFGALFSGLLAAGASAQATLTSDLPDYAPGATAYLTGAGFAPNETVAMQVVHADGDPATGADHDVWYVDSDDQGGFVATWHVCEDDCVGELLLATADQASGAHAETTFTDAPPCASGTGVVTLAGTGGSCLGYTMGNGFGPDDWEVVQGGSYTMTISGVTECSGNAITVFLQNSQTGNMCFTATGGSGTFVGSFTMPNPACFTTPISYKCGADAPCNNSDTFDARGPDSCYGVHLRAATFDSNCNVTGKDVDCAGGGCTPCTLVCPPDADVDCSESTEPSSTGTPTGCAAAATFSDDVVDGDCAGNYVITRHWSAPDGCGGTTTCDQTLTVTDTTAPTLDAYAEDQTVECDGAGNGAELAAWLASHGGAAASDACSGVNWTDDFTALTDGCGETGSATVTFTATDDCGNSVDTTATFTIEDTTDPTIDVGASDQTVECDGAGNAAALAAWLDSQGGAAASDGCSGVTWTNDYTGLSDGCGETGSATVVFTAADDCGNSADTTATFTIVDTTDPMITCPDAVTANASGACCIAVNVGEPTAEDGCSGVTVTSDAPDEFCVGETVVTWTATDDCGNSATCEQTVTVLGQICAKKFYDANANGECDGSDVGVPGWKFTVTDVPDGSVIQSGFTGSDGTVCFDVPVGTYTVTEGTPTQTNWVHTTDTSCEVTIDAQNCAESCSFGNYCYSAPANGLTIGFWTNKNGEKLLNTVAPLGGQTWQQCLNDPCGTGKVLRNANGTLHTFTTYADLKSWLNGATATNMAYMLSAQLAANILDGKYNGLSGSTNVLVPGGVKTFANVCIVPFLSVAQAITGGAPPLLALTALPGSTTCGCSSNDGLVTIADLRARACALLAAYGNTTGASTQRTYQECVKDILDMINNNGNPPGGSAYPCGPLSQYINSNASKCPADFPAN